MDEKIIEFINIWKECKEEVGDHIDFFIPNQKGYSYEDVREVMDKIKKQCNKESLNDMDVIAYIDCEYSKHIQKWGKDFWKLVDYTFTPPSIVIQENMKWKKSDYEEIIERDGDDQDEYINILTSEPDGELYLRSLYIISKRMIKNNE